MTQQFGRRPSKTEAARRDQPGGWSRTPQPGADWHWHSGRPVRVTTKSGIMVLQELPPRDLDADLLIREARERQPKAPAALATGSGGSLYLVDVGREEILRRGAGGGFVVVAGDGRATSSSGIFPRRPDRGRQSPNDAGSTAERSGAPESASAPEYWGSRRRQLAWRWMCSSKASRLTSARRRPSEAAAFLGRSAGGRTDTNGEARRV